MRHLDFSSFIILSQPGAKFQHVKRIILPGGNYELVTLIIGSNDFYGSCLPSEVTPRAVPNSFSALAVPLSSVCESVFALAMPHRFAREDQITALNKSDSTLERHTTVNKILYEMSLESRWVYHGVTKYVFYEQNFLAGRLISLQPQSSILKNRVFYKNDSAENASARHIKVSVCRSDRGCTCGPFRTS